MINYITKKSPRLSGWLFRQILLGIYGLMKAKRILVPSFRRRLQEKNFSAQIKTRDNSIRRTFIFDNGAISSCATTESDPDMVMIFRDAASALKLMSAPSNYLKQINATKNFVVDVDGPDEYVIWFMQTLKMLQAVRSVPKCGISMETIFF